VRHTSSGAATHSVHPAAALDARKHAPPACPGAGAGADVAREPRHTLTPFPSPMTRYLVGRPAIRSRSIAAKTGASKEDIARENAILPPYTVKLGQKLRIPGGRYHVVRKGQSGIAIARAYGVPWARIAELNKLAEPYILREGQRLVLPSQQEAASMSIEQRAEAFKLQDRRYRHRRRARACHQRDAASAPADHPAGRPAADHAGRPRPPRASTALFAWPIEGKIVRPFGPLANGARNDGINIAAAEGTPIYAAADGTVAYVGTDVAIYGGLILLRHGDGWLTAYGHAERLQVVRGQAVRKGQLIGYVGQAGLADQDQLHFEIRQGRTPVDPRAHLPKRG
jgi:lipoprotein NlpD